MIEVLKDYGRKATYKVIYKRQIGIFFQDIGETKSAEAALLEELKEDTQVIRV